MSSYTSQAEVDDAYDTLQRTFRSGKTKNLAWRKWQLKQIWWMIEDHEAEMVKALNADLNRHEFETRFVEFMSMKMDVLDHLKHLEEWAADEIPPAGFMMGTLSGARIRKEPLGVALIIGPWNFPVSLTIQPLIAAVTAGCAVMLKPSEMAQASQDLMVKMITKYLDQDAIRIVTGGPAETAKILEKKYDEVFFTGSSKVARFITAAAAKHLTPTVLELGGQGPAIVCESADLDLAARKIAWVKVLNAGQICLSVNHVFVHPNVHDQFVAKLDHYFQELLKGGPEKMSTIINTRNFDRLKGVLDKTRGKIVTGGTVNRDKLFIAPTVITNVTMKDPLLEEELFGPLLPVIKDNFRKAYQAINSLGHPLGIYIFSKDKAEIEEIISNTNSGGVTINEVMLHAGVPTTPFGGVGESGTGYYHGKHGFDAFTHTRTIVSPPSFLAKLMNFLMPPYDLKNLGKVHIKNKAGFKRGETIEDQKIGQYQFASVSNLLKLAAVVGVLAVIDRRTGENFGLSKALLSTVGSVKARIGSS